MSENMFEPLVVSVVDSCKILIKCINKVFGWNTFDFKDFFESIELKNKANDYPKLIDLKKMKIQILIYLEFL